MFSVSVLLYGIPFIALTDTGTSKSAISQDTWMQISHLSSVKLDPARRSGFQTVSGTPSQAYGTFQNSYQIGNNFYPLKTYVMKSINQFLDISSNIRQQSQVRRTPRPNWLFKCDIFFTQK